MLAWQIYEGWPGSAGGGCSNSNTNLQATGVDPQPLNILMAYNSTDCYVSWMNWYDSESVILAILYGPLVSRPTHRDLSI